MIKYVIIPQDKSGYEAGEVIRCMKGTKDYKEGMYIIAPYDNRVPNIFWQAQTVLVVDTEVEICIGDSYLNTRTNNVLTCRYINERVICNSPCYLGKYYKVIASSTKINNIPHLSPSFLKDVVDDVNSGESGSVVVDMDPCCEVNCTGECVSTKSHWKTELNPDGSLCCRVEKKEKYNVKEYFNDIANGRDEEYHPDKCEKPHCDCLDIAEDKNGGNPVKSYPCLAKCNYIEQLKSTPSNVEEMAKVVTIEGGKVKRIYTPEWVKSGDADIDNIPKIVSSIFSQRKHLVAYVAALHDYIDGYLAGNKDKDEAVRFAELLAVSGWEYNSVDKLWSDRQGKQATSEQLYTIYKTTQQ